MRREELSVDITHMDDGDVLSVRGEIDTANIAELLAWSAGEVGPEANVVIDLSGVSFLHSSALRSLEEFRADIEAGDRAFAIAARGDSVARKLLVMSDLVDVMHVTETVDDALADVAARPDAPGDPSRDVP